MVIPGGVAEKMCNTRFRKECNERTLTLPAETRERAGKGASRALRREGRVPAVIYGGKKSPCRSTSRKSCWSSSSAPATS